MAVLFGFAGYAVCDVMIPRDGLGRVVTGCRVSRFSTRASYSYSTSHDLGTQVDVFKTKPMALDNIWPTDIHSLFSSDTKRAVLYLYLHGSAVLTGEKPDGRYSVLAIYSPGVKTRQCNPALSPYRYGTDWHLPRQKGRKKHVCWEPQLGTPSFRRYKCCCVVLRRCPTGALDRKHKQRERREGNKAG